MLLQNFFIRINILFFDPTFNCLYKYKNKYIDHNELREINNNNVASDKITLNIFIMKINS